MADEKTNGTAATAKEKPQEPRTYTVLERDGDSIRALGEFEADNQREARKAAVESDPDGIKSAILRGETVELAAVSSLNFVPVSVKNAEPQLVF